MGFGRCSADVKKGGSPLGQKVSRATAALSKNLFDHVGAISNRSISPAYKQVQSCETMCSILFHCTCVLFYVRWRLLDCPSSCTAQPVLSSFRISFRHTTSMMIGFVFSKSAAPLALSAATGSLISRARSVLRCGTGRLPRRSDANWHCSRVRLPRVTPFLFDERCPIPAVRCYSDGRFLNGDKRLQRPSLAGEWKHDDVVCTRVFKSTV
jgi:hypothetical protein